MGNWMKAAVVGVMVLGLCGAARADAESDAKQLADCSNKFGWSLYQQLAEKEGNVLVSPHSLHAALAMAQLGARGRTAEQIASVLWLTTFENVQAPNDPALWKLIKQTHVEWLDAYPILFDGTPTMAGIATKDEKGFTLKSVNAMWAQKGYPFRKGYVEEVGKLFAAGLREIDFVKDPEAARRTINGWVEERTDEKIKDLLKRGIVDEWTRLVLTNAVYFKAEWAEAFKKAETKKEPFTLADGKKVEVETMRRTGEMAYGANRDMRAVRLMYEGGEVSMTVVLPGEGKTLGDVERAAAGGWDSLLKDMKPYEVTLWLPRFKFEADYDMVRPLRKLGMVDAFDVSVADFSGMDGLRFLAVSAVVQKTFIEVNEEGTEAAAASAVVMARSDSAEEGAVEFRVDRPFVFVIRHEPTGTILFVGRVLDPRE